MGYLAFPFSSQPPAPLPQEVMVLKKKVAKLEKKLKDNDKGDTEETQGAS